MTTDTEGLLPTDSFLAVLDFFGSGGTTTEDNLRRMCRAAAARIRELEAERQKLVEGFQLIEVDLEAGDLPPRIRVPLALRRTKAWIKVAQRAGSEAAVSEEEKP